jgi:hypothetical protein
MEYNVAIKHSPLSMSVVLYWPAYYPDTIFPAPVLEVSSWNHIHSVLAFNELHFKANGGIIP